jgi:RND family efflux transporter MFP subunit
MEGARKLAQNGKIRYELAKRKLLLTLGGNKALYEKQLKNLFTETMAEFFVLSPVSGTVIAMNVSEGTMVSSGVSTMKDGTTLMRVSDLSKMWIKTKINEVNIGDIKEGQKAKITLDAIANTVYNGRVVKISPKGETVDNVVSYEVTIELENPDQRLMPSMTANIDIVTHVEKNALYLPRIALTKWKGRDAVRVSLSHDDEKRFKVVGLGVKNESMVVIMEGLVEGEAVLVPKEEEGEDGRS